MRLVLCLALFTSCVNDAEVDCGPAPAVQWPPSWDAIDQHGTEGVMMTEEGHDRLWAEVRALEEWAACRE